MDLSIWEPVCRCCEHYTSECLCNEGAQWAEEPLCWRCDLLATECLCPDGPRAFERFLELIPRAAAFRAAKNASL
jgi:hypothetical protein